MNSVCLAGFLLVTVTAAPFAAAQTPLGSGATYQGQLKQGDSPANGAFPMVFALWDAATAGTQTGPTLTFDGAGNNPPPITVTDGLFSVALDFGAAAFNGDARWLEITVGGVTLSPRQAITAAPYSLQTRGVFVNEAGDKVGIGTSAPTARLHVLSGPDFNQVRVESSSIGGTWLNLVDTDTNGRQWSFISTGSGNGEGPGKLLIRDHSAFANRLVLDAAGNIGIGTNFPKQRLHVEGDYYGKGYVWLHAHEGDGQSGTACIQARDDSGASNIAMQLRTQENGTLHDAVHIAPNGNVGVGTIVPQDSLHIGSGAIRFPDNSRQTTAVRAARAAVVVDFGSFGAGTAVGQVAVPGAELGGSVSMSPDQDLPNGLVFAWARVSAAGIVRFGVRNVTTSAIDPPPITFYTTVINP